MVIPDPTFFHTGTRIRFFPSRIPNSHQRIEYFNPKNCFLSSRKYDPGLSSRIRIFLPIPDPGAKKAPDPGYRIRNTALNMGSDPDPYSLNWAAQLWEILLEEQLNIFLLNITIFYWTGITFTFFHNQFLSTACDPDPYSLNWAA